MRLNYSEINNDCKFYFVKNYKLISVKIIRLISWIIVMKSKKTIINYSYVNAYAKAMYQNYIKARRLYIPLSGFLESKQEELADQKELLNKLNNLKNLK